MRIEQVAKQLHVSRTTLSKVLNARPAFKERMQRFITRSAHERAFRTLGYDAFLANELSKLFVVIKQGE